MNHATTAPNERQMDSTHIEYPEGQAHGVTVYVQLDDDNQLYESLTDAQRRLNNERGVNGDSNNPHDLGEIDASWTDNKDTLGFFSTKVEYGKQRQADVTQFYGQVFNLYDDIEDAKIANNAAKRRLEVHKRSHDLVYKDGNEYTWPAGWMTGHQHEGTCLKIQCSYVKHPGNAIADAFEMLEESELLNPAELRDVKQPIRETVRFQGLESHHRIHRNHEHDAIETLRDSSRLVGTEGDGQIRGDFEKGHHQIYGFDTDSISILGFDSTVGWDYRGDEYINTIEKHYFKCYRHTNADSFPDPDPRHHPKIEIKAHGAYPGPAWPAIKDHLDALLNAHTADYAGVPRTGLIEDDRHDGPNQEMTVTPNPKDYRLNLKEYFKSDGLKKQIIAMLVNNRTDSAKDILYTVIRFGRQVSYDELVEETGLTKRTIRKWVRKMEELGIVDRVFSGCMFVRMSDFVREHLRGFIERMKPNGDLKRNIRRRKHERISARESDEPTPVTTQTVATDGGTDRPSPNAEPTESPAETTEIPTETPADTHPHPPPD